MVNGVNVVVINQIYYRVKEIRLRSEILQNYIQGMREFVKDWFYNYRLGFKNVILVQSMVLGNVNGYYNIILLIRCQVFFKIVEVLFLFNFVVNLKDSLRNVIFFWDFWSCILVDQNYKVIDFCYFLNFLEGSIKYIKDEFQLQYIGERKLMNKMILMIILVLRSYLYI